MTDAYTRHELRSLGDSKWPKRGALCHKCGTLIPSFSDLSAEQEAQLRSLAKKNPVEAMRQLSEVTGCSPRWAKIWVVHVDGPQPPDWKFRGPACPFCGKKLVSGRAKQCLHCGKNWREVGPGAP
jgi:hypothetical protein